MKIALHDSKTQAAVQRVINAPADSESLPENAPHCLYDAHLCLPRDKHNATVFGSKIYGVCTLVRRDMNASVKEVEWDLEGRVLVTELLTHGLAVFNIYAVNGTSNPYRDPVTGKVIGDRHMHKRAFHERLRDECVRYEEQGWKVCVAGDLNISRGPLDSYPQQRVGKENIKNRVHFEKCFMQSNAEGGKLEMRDTFRELKGPEKKYTYRPRGKPWGAGMDRVDLILLSSSKSQDGDLTLKEADILDSEEDRGPSDHTPIYVDLRWSGKHVEGVED
ncbi:MAG: hypothetical protein LQ342_002499 [Letrouitia transgressa]|nr:MAG: hypothetical protein LQ342_002499 [Letrouitia transgressa]